MYDGATMRLAGKVAVVTGGARGVGRALALGLAREGARVLVGDLEPGVAGAAALPAGAGEIVERRLDVTSVVELRAAMDAAVERFGRLDVLVNNAGITRQTPVLEVT